MNRSGGRLGESARIGEIRLRRFGAVEESREGRIVRQERSGWEGGSKSNRVTTE